MENEEKEDLLLDVTEESDSEVSDDCIQEKIFRLLETDKHTFKSWSDGLILIVSCLFLFISATIVLITLPVYVEESNRCGISTYSKIATLSTANVILFTVLCAAKKVLQRCVHPPKPTSHLYMCLPSVLKTSLMLSTASLAVFWLVNGKLVSCHLQDPLKGCVVVFSLLFYFIFSKRKTSVERVFCSITVIVGTFVTVDFGLCDRFRCRGADLPDTPTTPLTLHGLYVIGYVLALGAYALHFTYLENCCRCSNYRSSLDLSIVSSESPMERLALPMPITHSLSIISGGRPRPREPLNVSSHRGSVDGRAKFPLTSTPRLPVEASAKFPITSTPRLPMEGCAKFPITSTPNESTESWVWDGWDWLAAHHSLAWLLMALLCWVPTLGLFGKESRLLVEVLEEVASCFASHAVGSTCPSLWLPSSLLLASYVVLCASAILVLTASRSALTVVCVLMNALPMASLFWSVYQMDTSLPDVLTFKMGITGEAVSAMLGFPIIGIGTFLLLKSQVAYNVLHMRLQ